MRGAPPPDPEAQNKRVRYECLLSTSQCNCTSSIFFILYSDNFWQGRSVRNKVGARICDSRIWEDCGSAVERILPGSDPRSEGDPSEPEGPALKDVWLRFATPNFGLNK